MLLHPIATLRYSAFPFQLTRLLASVCQSVHRYARDPPSSIFLRLAQVRVHHLTFTEATLYSQEREETR